MNTKKILRIRRKFRIRAKISGTKERPRLTVFRSNYGLFAQLIDDVKGVTLISKRMKGKNKEVARSLGSLVARQAKAKHISSVVFDRSGYRYHGVIREFADAARSGGLQF